MQNITIFLVFVLDCGTLCLNCTNDGEDEVTCVECLSGMLIDGACQGNNLHLLYQNSKM